MKRLLTVVLLLAIGMGTSCGDIGMGAHGAPLTSEPPTIPAEVAPAAATSSAAPAVTEAPTLSPTQSPTPTVAQTFGQYGDDLPVSRAAAAKMAALAFLDRGLIDSAEREIDFADCSPELWFDRYVNAACLSGLMGGESGGGGDSFRPYAALTLNEAQNLLDMLDENNTLKMQIGDNGDKAISYALWAELYMKVLINLGGNLESFGVGKVSLVPLATPETNSRLTDGAVIADAGYLDCAGINVSEFVDKQITVLKKDDDVLAVLSVDTDSPTIRSCYIVNRGDNDITVFKGGAERTYKYEGEVPDGQIADAVISGGVVVSIVVYGDALRGTAKLTTTEFIELDGGVKLPLDERFCVYSVASGKVLGKTLSDIIVGTDIAEFVVSDGKAKAAVITKTAAAGDIRVALQTGGFSGFNHKSVVIGATADFYLIYGKKTDYYKAGQTVEITEDLFDGAARVYAESKSGKIIVESLRRSYAEGESPSYRGVIEISEAAEGDGYYLVNELPLEQYLYAVIPSEMPESFGLEAAKAQAVTARSYARAQFYANRFHKYGANVDDSVSCQVYNNIPETEQSITAARETEGLCLTYKGSVIAANFFSTSGGTTANSGEVWARGGAFPVNTPEYLSAGVEYEGGADYGDLRVEENAAKFLKSDITGAYDGDFAWFRWNVTFSADQISKSINAALADRYKANPRLIKTLQPNGKYLSREIDGIGDLLDIEVLERGEAGNILRVKLTGTRATITVATEYNIRTLLSPANVTITRKDDSKVQNYTILPSAFAVFEKVYENSPLSNTPLLAEIKIFGGGNGHGVGMSQNGVKGLINAGYNYQQILTHYYKGTEVTKP